MQYHVPFLAMILLFTGMANSQSLAAEAALTAQALVEAAVKAAGGAERLPRLFRWQETWFAGEDKTAKPREAFLVPPHAWYQDGKNIAVGDADRLEKTYLVWAWSLVPLLDPDSTLTLLPAQTHAGRTVQGVRLARASQPDIDLFFDSETRRLAVIYWRKYRIEFSGWREVDGFTFPAQAAVRHLEGRLHLRTEIQQFENLNHLLDPVWKGAIVYNESTVLLQETADGPLVGRLASPAIELLSVRDANRTRSYDLAKEVQLQKAGATLQLPATSPAARIQISELFPPTDSPASYKHRVNHPEQSLLYGPGRWFHDHQLEVTYRRQPPKWQTEPPLFAGDQLPRTIARLRKGEAVTVGISGDSISAGGDASGLNAVAPRLPPFPDLLAARLQQVYRSPITLKNRAVGGWSIANGVGDIDALLAEKPQLIVIAYGMNDVGRRNPAWFREQTHQLIQRVRTVDPTIEMILVSPMLGHKEWIHTPREMFFQYRDELKSLTEPGIALADVTAIWQELLQTKHDLDLTGNGLNHPNDFGHRLYAQALLALLVKE